MGELAVGQQVKVNLDGVYLAICGACSQVTLAVPGGVCSHCHAPESRLVKGV